LYRHSKLDATLLEKQVRAFAAEYNVEMDSVVGRGITKEIE
jgi:hypothetical protein